MASEKKKDKVEPLIPAHIIDVGSQRAYFVGFFLLIQAWKIQQCIILKANTSSSVYGNAIAVIEMKQLVFILKFFIIDSLYLLILPIFRIPLLTFSPFVAFLQSILVTCFTVLLSCNLTLMVSSLFTSVFAVFSNSVGNGVGISGTSRSGYSGSEVEYIKNSHDHKHRLGHNQDFLQDNTYFKGKKVINILPKSTSYFNPFHDTFCLDASSLYNVYEIRIPIKLNISESVSSLELSFTDFNNVTSNIVYNKKQLQSFVVKDKRQFNDYLKKDIIMNSESFTQNSDVHETVLAMDKSRISFLEIPVRKPGLYKLGKVWDTKNQLIDISRSFVIVSQCPTAQLVQDISSFRKSSSQEIYSCVGDENKLSIVVQGVPPLKVKYTKYINEKSATLEEKSLQPNIMDFKSPLMFGWSNLRKIKTDDLNRFAEWSNSYNVTIDISEFAQRNGDYSFKLEEVEDGFGNVISLANGYANYYDINSPSGFSSVEQFLEAKKVFTTFETFSSPKFRLINRQPRKTLKENEARDLHLLVDDSDFTKHEPILGNITFVNSPDDNNGKVKSSKILNYEFNRANGYKFVAKEPGSYFLESVISGHCPGVIDDLNTRIEIVKAFKPHLSIVSSSSIKDTCLGQIGLGFDLLLTGNPPFEIKVNSHRLEKNGKKLIDSKLLKVVSSNRFQYKYEPKSEGKYEIEFDSIHDSVYTDFIKLTPNKDFRFTTSMRAKPDAKFTEAFSSGQRITKKNLCLGAVDEILPVKLTGEAPFEITYDIVERLTNKRKTYTVGPIDSNSYNVKLPVFVKGGDYLVSLTSVKDKYNCIVLLEKQQVNIEINREQVYAEFEKMLNFKGFNVQIKEGDSINLPIKLSGRGQVHLEYELDGQKMHKVAHNSVNKPTFHSDLKVSKAGVYKLTTVKDNYCLGNANSEVVYNVSYYPKPEMTINESHLLRMGSNTFKKKESCLNEENSVINLAFKGQPPFTIDYTILLPKGQAKMRTVKVFSNFLTINPLSDLSPADKSIGVYKYIFKAISDSVYSTADLQKLPYYSFEPQIVEQKLVDTPRAFFKEKVLQTCSNNFKQPIVMALDGRGPYEVHLEIYSEHYNKVNTLVLRDIDSNVVTLNDRISKYLSIGNHIITIKKITDGRGCVNDDLPITKDVTSLTVKNAKKLLEPYQIMLLITETPRITKVSNTKNYCIGDQVAYKVHGSGPFDVHYRLNNKKNHANIKELNDFKSLLYEPGEFTVESVKDRFNCLVDLKASEDLKVHVYDKPSVEITNSFDENIQEGDQVEILFKFTGQPPFNLIYRRVFNDYKDFEVYHVNNIESNEYRITTSLQGLYEAIELKDQFCEVRRNDV